MGRGRAKAKQTKVARELKYGGPEMDLNRLRNDLGGPSTTTSVDDEVDAAYAALLGEDDEDEDDDED